MTTMWIKIKSMVEKQNQMKKKTQDISSSPLVILLLSFDPFFSVET
jgi:hypothetical protein